MVSQSQAAGRHAAVKEGIEWWVRVNPELSGKRFHGKEGGLDQTWSEHHPHQTPPSKGDSSEASGSQSPVLMMVIMTASGSLQMLLCVSLNPL